MSWSRYLFYRTERVKTTWTLRIGVIVLVFGLLWLTSSWWTVAVARSLVCDANPEPSDAILVENFDPNYLTFERATRLRSDGLADRVLVPVHTDGRASEPNAVALGTAEVMARISRLGSIAVVPTHEDEEPIALNAAIDVLDFIKREHIRSVIVVSPLFRSRRSMMVYDATLGRAGVMVRCEPVVGTRDAYTWTRTWHGVQDVLEQWIKLQYYRFYVVPFRLRASSFLP